MSARAKSNQTPMSARAKSNQTPMSAREPGAARSVLEVDNLTITAGSVPLVSDVSFRIGPRERVGIIGASGSGKTLTCMAVAGLLPEGLQGTGSIRLDGFDGNIVTADERRLAAERGRLTGMVFQEPMTALNPTMRVDKQVAEVLLIHGSRPDRRSAREVVLELLEAVGLQDPERIARSYPHQLSGGQRQRVVLAIALANSPALLICDEPTTALDVSVQARVLELIDARTAAIGSALLFISHDLAVVASLCDYLLVMWEGRIVERGPVVEVLADPQHDHTRRLLVDADLGLGPMTRPAAARPDGGPDLDLEFGGPLGPGNPAGERP
jgi:peptide/nickel transport system ATP-binding protein